VSVRAAVTELAPGTRTLSRDASHYLCRVLRLREGDRFVAFDPQARVEADAVVDHAAGDAATVTIEALRPAAVIALRRVALVYGLAKGEKVDAVVRDASELGATHVFVAQCARSVARADGDRAAAKVERWRRISEEAARQAGRADPPLVEGVLPWASALERAAAVTDARFCLWENATSPLGAMLQEPLARKEAIAFAIGPEGGLTAAEVEAAAQAGFREASLGRFILRTETAPAAVLGALRVFDPA